MLHYDQLEDNANTVADHQEQLKLALEDLKVEKRGTNGGTPISDSDLSSEHELESSIDIDLSSSTGIIRL